MEVKLIESILQIGGPDWNAVSGNDYPFLRHEFLAALERCGSVSEQTGWRPRHLLIYECQRLIAAMPLYLKYHSSGEYVFDHQWADAYHRHNLAYYPKWVTAIPFTPCRGPRLAVKAPSDSARLLPPILTMIRQLSDEHRISSWHCLFPCEKLTEQLKASGLSIREDVQFHWFNRGYRDFGDFLEAFTAAKRKMIKRERKKVAEAGIEFRRLSGTEVNEDQWRSFFQFYRMTYLKKGMHPYLNLDFFLECSAAMADRMLLVLALKKGRPVGAALSFIGSGTLYGRYWGCFEEFNFLHFETCYYQGIDYCIEQGLRRFDSGAQGEHKIARGFEPIVTHSAHWIRDPGFARAIELFLAREKKAVHNYRLEAANYLPFKKFVD